MEIIDNIHKTWCADLSNTIKQGSKVSIAASCFSIYAFQELKKTLEGIDELRFIFTSPTFISDKSDKQKREFYIPRFHRERSLTGTEFEVKLLCELDMLLPRHTLYIIERNEKAICGTAKEDESRKAVQPAAGNEP